MVASAAVVSPIVFDFFIAPNGDDVTGSGSLASPWSITALKTKQTTYRTHKVGIIGDISGTQTPIQYGTASGTQSTLFSLLNAVTDNTPVLPIDGGTVSNPTYIGSCDSTGAYKRGWAIIDCAQPGTGTHPSTDGCQLMGQCGDSGTQVPHPDNLTIDGLTIRNFSFSGITVQSASAILTNVLIKNCELYGSNNASTASNPGCIRFDRCPAQVINCKFHDCSSTSGGFPPAYSGIMAYTTQGLVVTNCTFYNMDGAVQQKDANQDATISYCYMDYGSFGVVSGGTYGSYYEGMTASGRTTTIHHCIMLGPMNLQGGVPSNFSGNYNFYNNTMHVVDLSTPLFYWQQPNSGATFHAYNNVFTEQGGSWTNGGQYGVAKATGANTTLIPTWDYNYYLSSPQFCPSGTGTVLVNYASWQALGFDAHSNTGGLPYASTPSALNMSSFTISNASAANTGSNTGGICGALDGTGSIGCNF